MQNKSPSFKITFKGKEIAIKVSKCLLSILVHISSWTKDKSWQLSTRPWITHLSGTALSIMCIFI